MAQQKSKKDTSWMEDGDDAHFVPIKKHHAKKRVATRAQQRKAPLSPSERKRRTGKRTTRKRVAGK
jgi:hypothetical protein